MIMYISQVEVYMYTYMIWCVEFQLVVIQYVTIYRIAMVVLFPPLYKLSICVDVKRGYIWHVTVMLTTLIYYYTT